MSKYKLLVSMIVLFLLAVSVASLPPLTNAQEVSPGGENFIFVNYIGQDMTFDLDDVTYTIPGTATAPEGGRLTLTLAPGEHKYAANIPGVRGSAGEFTLTAGEVVARAARLEQTSPVVEDGILLEKPQDYVFVFDFDPNASPVEPEPAPVVDTWQPTPAAPGMASLVWINYAPDELTVDLNGQIYKVAPPENGIPGRLQIGVEPGEYTYTASIPYGSINGKISAIAGEVLGLTVTSELPPAPDYDIGEEFDLHPEVTLRLTQEDLTARAAAVSTEEPAAADSGGLSLPEAGTVPPPMLPEQPAASDGLLIKNYAGDTLTFTIDNQTYSIPNNAEQTLNLPPGEYTFTASTPFVATTGSVNLNEGQGEILSVAINVSHDHLNVYRN